MFLPESVEFCEYIPGIFMIEAPHLILHFHSLLITRRIPQPYLQLTQPDQNDRFGQGDQSTLASRLYYRKLIM